MHLSFVLIWLLKSDSWGFRVDDVIAAHEPSAILNQSYINSRFTQVFTTEEETVSSNE